MATHNNIDTFAALQNAINAANSNNEADVITITGDINLTGLLPIIEESETLTIDGGGFTISGDANGSGTNDTGDVRLFFVRNGTVAFDSLTFSGGRAEGGTGGGGGAGMGGALFINDGDVTVTDSQFIGNQAIGGKGSGGSGFDGSGGGGGGGIGISEIGSAKDGSTATFSTDGGSGGGGGGGNGGGFGGGGGNGGFGGGGGGGGGGGSGFGGGGGNGGFGGGGGDGGGGDIIGGIGGNGGFGGFGGGGGGGGGGDFGSAFGGGGSGFGGNGGFGGGFGGIGGGGGGGGGGLGGAVFIRSGSLSVTQSNLTDNMATGGSGFDGSGGQGLGGAIFAMTSTQNSNGNDQGMPASLPTVTTTGVIFSGNTASDANGNTADNGGGNDQNNNDVFGSITAVVVDTVAPTVTAISRQSPTAQETSTSSVTFKAFFSEVISGIAIDDFTLKTTGAVSGAVASVSATTGDTVEVTVNNITGEGTLSLDVPSTATLPDAAGNAFTTAFTTGETYTIDNTTATPTISGDAITNSRKPTFSGTAEADATVELLDGTTSLGTTNADISGNWSFTPAADLGEGSYTLTAKATDSFGNISAESVALAVTIDSTAPTVILSSPSAATVNSAFAATATFSEATTDFTDADVVVDNGTIGNFSGNGTTYTFDVTPTANGTVTVDVSAGVATDAAGNGNTIAAQLSRKFDEALPILLSIVRQTPTTAVTNADSLVFRTTFSEAVQNVDATDFAVTGTDGTLTINQVSDTRYDLTVSGGNLADLEGSVGISLAADQNITDLADNALPSTAVAINESYSITQKGELAIAATEVLEIKAIRNSNTITFSLDQLQLGEISELLIFTTDADGNNLSQIESFSLLRGGDLPDAYSPSFSLETNNVSADQFLQFQLVSNGIARTATISAMTGAQVQLTFDDGTVLNAGLGSRTATTNLLTGDADGIDLSTQTGTVNVDFTVFREASFDNTVGLYTTDSADGNITDSITNAVLKPGDAGYKEAALARKLDVQLTGTNGEMSQFTSTLEADGFLGVYLIAEGSDATTSEVYFSHMGANSAGADHVKLLGNNTFGFEDMAGLGDADYNDVVVQFKMG